MFQPQTKVMSPATTSFETKTIINESLQTFQICLLSPKGNQLVTLGPRKSMVVNQSEISQMVLNLARRKIVKII